MPQLFRNRPFIITIIVAFLLIIVMIFSSSPRALSNTESLVGSVVTSIERFFYDLSGSVANLIGGIFSGRDIEKENAELHRQVEALTAEAQRADELELELERLRELLRFQEENPNLTTVSARVVAKEPGFWFSVFTINAGRNAGIKTDMAVINSDGLVGRIIEVGGNWSKVLAIIDPRSSISAILQRTRFNGIVKGNLQDGEIANESGLCRMLYLPFETDLIPGDVVLTSGLGGIYPKGIHIGEIVEVSTSAESDQQYAIIRTSVDFLRLEEVMVVIDDTESRPTP